MSLTIELPADLEVQLRKQARQQGKALEQYVAGLIRQHTASNDRGAPALSAEETLLFERINKGFPEDFWQKLHQLDAKRKNYTLTEPEREELISMTFQLEAAHAERMEALALLAQLRQTDVDTLMSQLGL